MVPLNYNQLYYFFKIAELGSIADASKSILISSPALSMQLKELETTLGTALFDRVGKKLVLTEAGSIVFEYAKDIFNLGIELRDTLGDRGKERLRIEIGCQDSVPKNIADTLLAFLIKKKQCKVTLREGNLQKLLEMQRNFKLDIVLTNSNPSGEVSGVYETKLLSEEGLILVGHPKYLALKKKFPSSLEKIPFILPTFESSCRQKIENFLHEKNLSIDVIAEVEDRATEVDLAIRGFGLIITSKKVISHLITEKKLVEIGPIDETDEVWMIVGKRKILNPLALYALKNFSL